MWGIGETFLEPHFQFIAEGAEAAIEFIGRRRAIGHVQYCSRKHRSP